MKKWELAWKRFEETGSISDYLIYRHLNNHIVTEGETSHADFDRWNRTESEKSWQ